MSTGIVSNVFFL